MKIVRREDKFGEYVLDDAGNKLRDPENVATVSEGTIQAYTKVGFEDGLPRAQHGARLLDPNTGQEKIRTDGHPSKRSAADWILLALGFSVLVGIALVLGGGV